MNPLFFYFFATLIGTAKCFPCVCNAQGCTSDTCEATGTNICYTTTTEHTLEGSAFLRMEKGCIDSSVCKDRTITLTVGKGIYLRTKTQCCSTERCNALNLEAPKEDTTISKVACPSCFGIYPASCEPTVMRCPESESQCINITGSNGITESIGQVPFAARGCATPSASIIQQASYFQSKNTIYVVHSSSMKAATTNSASQAPRSITLAILLPSLIGISFTKFLS